MNGHLVNLWDRDVLVPGQVFTERPRDSKYLPPDGHAVSLFGTGHVILDAGEYSTDALRFGYEFEFRTFQEKGVLMDAVAKDGDVFNVYLEEGKVKLRHGDGDFTIQTTG